MFTLGVELRAGHSRHYARLDVEEAGAFTWCADPLTNQLLQSILERCYGQQFWVEEGARVGYPTGCILELNCIEEIELDDCPTPIALKPLSGLPPPPSWLSHRQLLAVSAFEGCSFGRGIIRAATGFGKTRVALGIAWKYGGRWVYVVGSRELAAQTAAEMERLEPDVARQVTCVSYGGLKALVLAGQQFQGLLGDEVHESPAWLTRGQWIAKVSAPWKLGMSATPYDRTDHKNSMVTGLFGPIFYQVKMDQAVSEGRVCRGVVLDIQI